MAKTTATAISLARHCRTRPADIMWSAAVVFGLHNSICGNSQDARQTTEFDFSMEQQRITREQSFVWNF